MKHKAREIHEAMLDLIEIMVERASAAMRRIDGLPPDELVMDDDRLRDLLRRLSRLPIPASEIEVCISQCDREALWTDPLPRRARVKRRLVQREVKRAATIWREIAYS